MLFNSYVFIFAFLPVVLGGFFLAARVWGPRAALSWVVFGSLFFYGWWNPRYLALIALSVGVNFLVGRGFAQSAQAGWPPPRKKLLLVAGVVFNLGLLGYYKYANFFVDTVNWAAGTHYHLERIFLPLAISFFTFQQIAYLVDASRGRTRPYTFLEYCFLVTFFPHLIAGPIVQHGDLLSQIQPKVFRPSSRNLALGGSMFVLGLFKKVVIADRLAPLVTSVYSAGVLAEAPTTTAAWVATIAYTLQLYFDFSGYSDMAIGLARMFNFKFPLNFNSPYKANSIIDFWRRWHMSLSRFLKEYLYFSIGGNRRGPVRRQVNLLMTMLLGGLWHGAGWGFVIWGGLNGVYLVANHLWRQFRGIEEEPPERPWYLAELFGLGTIVLVMFSRVFFRSPDLAVATQVLQSLLGLAPSGVGDLATHGKTLLAFAGLWAFVRYLPNTQELFAEYDQVTVELKVPSLRWSFQPAWAVVAGMLAFASVLSLTNVSEFLYFQF